MATLKDAQLLSLDVYNGTPQAKRGWTQIDQTSDGDSGFHAAAYAKGNEIVIAFRGWNGLDPRDVVNIERAYAGDPFEQIDDAQNFVDDIIDANPGANISLTGHSLGGALAAIMAVRNDLQAQTFAGIESVGAAFNSMNGFDFDVLGETIWSIPNADENRDITEAELSDYAGVRNHVLFGDVATYIDKTVPLENHIGIDRVYARDIRFGIREDDSLFGRYSNVYGDLFAEIVDADPRGTPYSAAFETQLHSLGFHALELNFKTTLDPLWTALPRLAFQLTNDRLGSSTAKSGEFQVTYGFLDQVMLDHLNSSGGPTVASAMVADFQDIASAGPGGAARANANINTAILQLAIEYGSVQTLGRGAAHETGGIVANRGDELAVNLGAAWDVPFTPEGARMIRQYANHLLGGSFDGAAANAATLIIDANGNTGTKIAGSGSNDLIFGGFASDSLGGGGGSDAMFAGGGDDNAIGGAGRDYIVGGNGDDTLNGASGSDILIGKAGRDRLIGGIGEDGFVFDGLATGADVVADFASNNDDIYLQNSVFRGIGDEGLLAPRRFFVGPAAHDGDDRIRYNGTTGELFYDADGTGAAAQVRIAVLASDPVLVRGDFIII